MSSSLVKKALEIFDSVEAQPTGKGTSGGKVKKAVKVKKKNQAPKHKGLSRGNGCGALIIKKTQEQARNNPDRTQENLEVLLSLSKEKHSKFTSRILERTGRTTASKETPPANTSIFSEEDFAKFEQEYFVN